MHFNVVLVEIGTKLGLSLSFRIFYSRTYHNNDPHQNVAYSSFMPTEQGGFYVRLVLCHVILYVDNDTQI